MNRDIYSRFISDNGGTFDKLAEKRVFLVSDLVSGGLLHDKNLIEYNCKCFPYSDLEILGKLINSRFFTEYNYPVLIDAPKAIALYKNSTSADSVLKEKTAILLSRFSFMGTDGMRGKVAENMNSSSVSDFAGDNIITAELIKLTSCAYAKMLLNAGIVKKGDTACVGNDGRDRTTGWKLNKAMIEGFNAAGLNVCDIGINPTPYVPWKMLKSSLRAGAMLTASHNPANQNGIKFFLDGKKNLPEGELGDYSFAAWMYGCFLDGITEDHDSSISNIDIKASAETLLLKIIPQDLRSKLNNAIIVLDTANGAYTDLSISLLEKLNLDYVCINETPTGDNINKACGVAEIEGSEVFPASGYMSYLKVIQEVFNQGRIRERPVYGVVLDGDGDRGFILYYDKNNDAVYTVDGDKAGYIIADYLIRTGDLNPKDYQFVLTVESDLMAAYSAKNTLGLNTSIVSVGDKWISTFDEGNLLLGLESSGHLICPIIIKNESGRDVELRTGNGLLTCMMVLTAIGELKLSGKSISEPFESGFSRTFYTYFVDKSLFFRDSSVWNKDKKIICDAFDKLTKSGQLTAGTKLVFEDKEDPHMLYASIMEGGSLLASIFCRNSGTEDKTAVYLKCKQEMESRLLPVALELKENHLVSMKNKNRIEYEYEKIIVESLADNKELLTGQLKSILDKEFSKVISESDIYSVIYALKKEGRASFENNLIKLKVDRK